MAAENPKGTQSELWSAAARVRARLMIDHLRPIWNAALDQVKAGPGVRLLDAGCGSGDSCEVAIGRGADVTGIDISDKMIEMARERCPTGRFEVADVQALPFPDGAFDAVISIHCIHFAGEPAKAVRELARVTRPGGRVAIVSGGEPQECTTATMARTLIGLVPEELRKGPMFIDPFRCATPGIVEGFATGAGMKVLETGKVDCPNDWESIDVAIQAGSSMGLYHAASEVVGEDKVKEALRGVFSKHVQPSGRVLLPNRYRFVCSTH